MIRIIVGLFAVAVTLHIMMTWFIAIKQGHRARKQAIRFTSLHEQISVLDEAPLVSVLVPAWNETGILAHCINALKQIDYQNWEAIVIAGGTDSTFDYAKTLCHDLSNFHVVLQPPYGKNAALNIGLQHANGDIVVILDADSRVQANWLRELVTPLFTGTDAATGNYEPLLKTPISKCEKMEHISVYEIHGRHSLHGSGAIALWRYAINEIGGFPEDIPVGVDWDLSLRLTQHGFHSSYVPGALLVTERPANLSEFWRNETRWRRAHFALLFQHFRWLINNKAALYNHVIFYFIAIVSLFSVIITAVGVVMNWDGIYPTTGLVTLLFFGWIVLRKASLAAQIAVYKNDLSWLTSTPILALLTMLSMAACIWAVLTLHLRTYHYKGPRTSVEQSA